MNKQALIDRVHKIAKEAEIPFNECWKQLLLERFLARLSLSEYSDKFIFKGGFLLSYMMEIGRETIDLDFLLTKMNASEKEIEDAIQRIASIALEDGFSFLYETLEFLEQPHMDYPGYRVILRAAFSNMKDKIQIDVGIGDIVKPVERDFHFFEYRGKPIFEREISLLVYPPETIFAEKLETVLSKGSINSRMKDYHDLVLLIRNPTLIQQDNLKAAITNTFQNRRTIFELIVFDEDELKRIQKLWTAHFQSLGKKGKDLGLPKNIQEIIREINSYLVKMSLISLGNIVAELSGKKMLEQVQAAIIAGADVNDNSRNGHRSLQMALKEGYSEVARLLIEGGADVLYCDHSGLNPLQMAINYGQFENANLLIEKGAPFNPNNLQGYHYPRLYQFQHFGRNQIWLKRKPNS
ncbi:nucleotidyl transferase AbiEii/AbiGii toxin family protein [Candidatus Protochlamydia phocaeensis]|uniref:nucleotidyl transferase AbiEii/AbiGii toxin family protein n=1 Tax=Candidatus Protochlamydia phocaeensis TaxID=1414722 RepID=UPI0009AD1BF4|nr:nucleotidyl transferase AbiEii/AbiGii toxin family protein [Candidatus Protochlamydia phocaeensis]